MRDKRGAVEWTVGRLMAIVLAVVLLTIVVFGWNSAIWPLVERAGGMANEVLILFHVRGEGDISDCIPDEDVVISGVGEGILKICGGYCEVRLDMEGYLEYGSLKSKRFKYNRKDGVMNDGGTKDNEQWFSFDQSYLGLDVDKVGFYREVYFELNETLCGSVSGGEDCDLEKLESVVGFNPGNRLEFKIDVVGDDLEYRLEGSSLNDNEFVSFGGYYESRFDSRVKFVSSIYEGYYKNGRDVFYGYRNEEGRANKKIDEGMDLVTFGLFISGLVNDWNDRFSAHEEWSNRINEVEVDVRDVRYPLGISEYQISGVSIISFVSIDLGEDMVGIYCRGGKFHFYSDKEKGKYDYVVLFSDDEWKDIVKINKIYDFLKDAC